MCTASTGSTVHEQHLSMAFLSMAVLKPAELCRRVGCKCRAQLSESAALELCSTHLVYQLYAISASGHTHEEVVCAPPNLCQSLQRSSGSTALAAAHRCGHGVSHAECQKAWCIRQCSGSLLTESHQYARRCLPEHGAAPDKDDLHPPHKEVQNHEAAAEQMQHTLAREASVL